MKRWIIYFTLGSITLFSACERLDDKPETYLQEPAPSRRISLEDVAGILGSVRLGSSQMEEVHSAVSSSAENGYDSEYRMTELFESPGTGVGSEAPGSKSYETPLRELIRDAVYKMQATKADGEGIDPEEFLSKLSSSDAQIYWPFSESWDGQSTPIVTFDPGDNSVKNIGYYMEGDGSVKEVIVDEDIAGERPVWVVNWNDDASYRSLEMLRREDPSWGSGGGDILVKSDFGEEDGLSRTLVLRSFRANRNYDSWFAGASEFFVKCGAIEDFTASTDAELRLYEPSITDFMIVVRRSQVGQVLPFNAVLVSEWTDLLTNCAFMMTEDDGGAQTNWKCSAVVKYNSKSYGFEIDLPLRTRDDIVWRGALNRNYVERFNGQEGHFGDVDLVLELI
ncbi:MAG: hypothetical protein II652_05475 [Bacteroidales bacterium]|nr:hypothetical protein [Bacteroidales bacterium]